MRCLLVITRSDLGGAQRHVLELLNGLHARHHLMLVCGDDGWLMTQAKQLGIERRIIPNLVQPIHPRLDVAAFRSLRALIAAWKPDLVHAHSSKAGVVARLAAASLGVPSLFTAHGWAFQPSYGWLRRHVALILERTAASLSRGPILCVSRFDRDLALSHHFPGKQIRVVHNGIPDFEETEQAGPRNPHRVVMVARFAAPKDHETLVRAIALVPQVQVELIGNGPDQERIRRLVARLGLNDRCWFSGAAEDVPQRLTQAGIFALSSRTEGLPICILEAMRAGLPVIASAVGGISELVDHGVGGLLVPPGDPAALATALRRLVQDPALSRTMGRFGRQRFLDHFRQDKMLRAVERAWVDTTTGRWR
jgi:glycosyltransferase involved in cell wall biosynthesis